MIHVHFLPLPNSLLKSSEIQIHFFNPLQYKSHHSSLCCYIFVNYNHHNLKLVILTVENYQNKVEPLQIIRKKITSISTCSLTNLPNDERKFQGNCNKKVQS